MKKGTANVVAASSISIKHFLKAGSYFSSSAAAERLSRSKRWSNSSQKQEKVRALPQLLNVGSAAGNFSQCRPYHNETPSHQHPSMRSSVSHGLGSEKQGLQILGLAPGVTQESRWTEQSHLGFRGSSVRHQFGFRRGLLGQPLHGHSLGAVCGLPIVGSSQRGFFGGGSSKPDAPPPVSPPAIESPAVEPLPATEGGLVSSVSGYFEGWKVPESVSSSVEGLTKTVQEYFHKLPPEAQEALNPSNPYFQTVAQETGIFLAFIGAWTLLPRYLRSIHRQVGESTTFLGDKISKTKAAPHLIPYEYSVFNAVEDPARFIISLVAFTHAAVMVAPKSDLGVFLNQAWGGGLVLSFVWFLYRWKSNYFARVLSGPVDPMEREKFRSLDRVSSIGLGLLATLSVAETSGFAVQSILTVGGIGGVATAFAARDVIGNVLSGAMLYLHQPFNIGDTILAGNVRGKVVDVGLHSTQLLNSDKHPVSVPNSFFSSQVIVNESRAQHRGFSTKIPLLLEDLGKVPVITRQIRGMLVNHPKVFTAEERPRCFLSKVAGTHVELTISCNVPAMSKDEFLLAEEEILFDVARIINELNAKIGESAACPPGPQFYELAKAKEHPEINSPTF